MSYDAVQEAHLDKTHRPGFRLPYKDGYSPEAMAHIARLGALIEIRRHIFGQAKRKKWITHNNQYNTFDDDI